MVVVAVIVLLVVIFAIYKLTIGKSGGGGAGADVDIDAPSAEYQESGIEEAGAGDTGGMPDETTAPQ